MKIGLIGLGKMGLNLALNMQAHQVTVFGTDLTAPHRQAAADQGIATTTDLTTLLAQLPQPRIIWVMVPAGPATTTVLAQLTTQLAPGDIVIDGGNSFYRDSIQHGQALATHQIAFFDVGTSGGQAGALNNGNFMIGGDPNIFPQIEPLFKAIAAPGGYLYTGPVGSGHYLKMVHNGIEYGMMAAIGEGFDVLQHSDFDYDNAAVANLWNHGSIIRSWLMALTAEAFTDDNQLAQLKGIMHSSGEGRWTLDAALDQQIATPVIAMALLMRYRSTETDTFTGKVVAALRNEFGGHAVDKQ
ncbi:6-phosphogluconate dehydrogenase (decarboxylating) [Lactobacillus sp. CBA3606]|uniref:phosphogluconate dehydrogenase (NAD(+)-dependent, decarboxylating) n=1 Tax=Lactobacillus sp. CBA3606 TaxID=2099789 RepID=UPI000CFB31BB|nr:decarboxylating 6-phosphogluconate dehydrogenase [Lactobacillus sp. CBA3606]AVK63064.1 6-phosphogluconate dehydrogenase (decarboxylating) [Lactobacillus sp. CBA3606]